MQIADKIFRLKKRGLILALVSLVLASGVFFRAWNFSDWLHFELDQARDAKVVGLALEHGAGNLPLLGPKAAGSFLRLGPLFYYTEYLSGLLFGNTPAGLATISLLISCLTLPLFYFFVRRYFNFKISTLLLLLFSFSLFLIMYSRFAWNPNTLPFFALGFFYSLLRATDHGGNRKGWWLVSAAVFFSFASQMHFVALLALPPAALAYLLIKRPGISPKFWIASTLIIVFFYIPPIINDAKTGGDNIKEFQKVFFKKSARDADRHSLAEKTARGISETILGYFIISAGYQKAELPKFREISASGVDAVCDNDCRQNLPMGGVATLIFAAGLILLIANLISKNEVSRKNFVIISGLWFLATAGLFVPIAYDLAPRFFLLVAPLPFIFLGFIFEFLEKKRLMPLGYIFTAMLLASNGYMLHQRFSELSRAPKENFRIETDKILKERDRVTLEQQLLIADYMESAHRQNSFPVYVNSEAFYRRAFLYHLEQRDIPRDDFRNSQISKKIYARGNYFLIYPAKNDLRAKAEKYLENYAISEQKEFGTLTAIRLIPKIEAVNAAEQAFGPEKKPTSASGVPVRCRWNEIFKKCNPDEELGEETN